MASPGAGDPAPGPAAGTARGGARMRPDEREVAPTVWGAGIGMRIGRWPQSISECPQLP